MALVWLKSLYCFHVSRLSTLSKKGSTPQVAILAREEDPFLVGRTLSISTADLFILYDVS